MKSKNLPQIPLPPSLAEVHTPAVDPRARTWELKPIARALRNVIAGGSIVACAAAQAGPQGEVVQAGIGAISRPDLSSTVVTQGSQRLAVQWDSFNVGQHENVRFDQPNAAASVLNRIVDVHPSQVFGQIRANGHVLLLNPNGVVFGPSSHVRVGNLTAAAHDAKVEDFMAGQLKLEAIPGSSGAVVNQGVLEAATGGSVTLIGRTVQNDGLIVANRGQVTLAAGDQATVDFTGDGLLQIAVDAPVTENAAGAAAAVTNDGTIDATGGQVLMTASAARDVFSNVVVNNGLVTAGRIQNEGGVIRLVATGDNASISNSGALRADGVDGAGGQISLESTGTTVLHGQALVSATSNSAKGGEARVLGARVGLFDNAHVNVSGVTGGGTALIGGNYQGKGPERNAEATRVASTASIAADATANGDGGTVVVWADGVTRYEGAISARGGAAGGNGGTVEVSGKGRLDFDGAVDTSAPVGEAGSLLLDPDTVNVVLAFSEPPSDVQRAGEGQINKGQGD